jgi:hypothetical protein
MVTLGVKPLMLICLLSFRLNLQHRITVKAFDGKLVMAPVSLKDGDHVLDIGTGTGQQIAPYSQMMG